MKLTPAEINHLKRCSQSDVPLFPTHSAHYKCFRNLASCKYILGDLTNGYVISIKGNGYLTELGKPKVPQYKECIKCFQATIKHGVCTSCGAPQNKVVYGNQNNSGRRMTLEHHDLFDMGKRLY